MKYLKAAVLLLAISGAAGRDILQQQVEQGRGYAGESCPLQIARNLSPYSQGGCTGSGDNDHRVTPATSTHEAQTMYPEQAWALGPHGHLGMGQLGTFIYSIITRLPIRRSGASQQTFFSSPPACPVLGFPPPCG